MKFFFGLGNIGNEYKITRHNVGFILIDNLIEYYNFSTVGTKFHSEVFTGTINGETIICLKPNTYMNLSGKAVSSMLNFYKPQKTDIFVFTDELDLPVGELRLKFASATSGHNGLRSIDSSIGKDYWRIKIGIDRPVNHAVSDYVLSKFKTEELENINSLCENFAKNSINELIELKSDDAKGINLFNKKYGKSS
jgi:PTH1 family peptidyl-tRNA hydrolase